MVGIGRAVIDCILSMIGVSRIRVVAVVAAILIFLRIIITRRSCLRLNLLSFAMFVLSAVGVFISRRKNQREQESRLSA
jgi:hypothetical protein